MRSAASLALLTAFVIGSACHRSAIEPSQSLVGAKQLPSAKTLSRETVQINSGGFGLLSPMSPGDLTYELRSDDSLWIKHTKYDPKTIKYVTIGQETIRLPSDVATRVKRMLWRLRPERLEGIEHITLPLGCPPPPIDSSPDFFLDFIAEGQNSDHPDDRVAIVNLPNASNCGTSQAADARNLVRKALQSFPPSKVAREYDLEVARWKARIGL